MSGVVVACAVRAPAGPERTDDVLGPWSGWVVASAWACGVASSNRPALACRLRYPHVCSEPRSLWCSSLTNPSVLTLLVLGLALKLPGCKRLHLTLGPSQVAQPPGREETQIVSGWRWLRAPRRCSLRVPTVALAPPPSTRPPILPGRKRLHLTFSPSWAVKRLLHFELLAPPDHHM